MERTLGSVFIVISPILLVFLLFVFSCLYATFSYCLSTLLSYCLSDGPPHQEDDEFQSQLVYWQAIMTGAHNPVAASRLRRADPRLLALLPVHVYEKKDEAATSMEEGECVICLSDLEEKDEFRVLPGCSHWFHRNCIDQWLMADTTCPVCRAELNLRYIEAIV